LLHQDDRSKSSKSDEWWTPHDLFWELCDKYNFYPEIDVAATEANSLCRYFFTKKDNALKRDWIIGKKKRKCWNNPPAKEQGKFITQAYQQYRDLKIKTMQIVPLNVQSSKAFQNVQKAIEKGEKIMVRPIIRRRVFLYKGKKSVTIKRKRKKIKKKITSSINGYCVIIYGKSRDYGFRT